MAILATSTTLLGQNVPKVCLQGDQSQGYVFDPATNCFVNEQSVSGCTNSCTGSCTGSCSCSTEQIIEGINCYSTVGDGATSGYIIPWRAANEQSLIVTLDGVKQQDADYRITQSTNSTLVTLASPVGVGVDLEITGFVVSDPNKIRRVKETGDGTTTEYSLSWIAVSKQSLIISIDGIIQQNADFDISYTAGGATIVTFTAAPANASLIEFVGIQGFGASTFRLYEDTGDNVTTDYVIPWYSSTCGSLLITVDGVKQDASDYDVTPIGPVSTTVSFNVAPGLGAAIEIIGYTGFTSELCQECDVVGNNLGIVGEGVYSSASESGGITTLDFKRLREGTGITLTSDADGITISSPGGGGTFANVGTGREVLIEPVTTTVNFRTLTPGNGMVLTETADSIIVAFDGDADTLNGAAGTDYATTLIPAAGGTGESIIKKGTAGTNSTFELYTIREGSGITVTQVGDDLVIADANGGNYVQVIASYNVQLDDAIVGVADTTAPRVITLPNTALAGEGKNIAIKDESNAASGNNILIQGFNGSQTIDGATNISITSNGGSVRLYTDGNVWFTTETSDGTGLQEVEDDLSPTLGGNLDVGSFSIISSAAQSIAITPDTTGRVIIDGLIYPDTDGSNGWVLTTNGGGLLSFQSPGIVGVLDDLSDVDTTSTPPSTNDSLQYDGANWVPRPAAVVEEVVFRYTSGSGGDLTAGDAIVSSTAGVTPTVLDGANSIVEFEFTGYNFPPVSIMVYGQDHQNNQWNIRDASSFVGSRAISNDTSGDADNPDLINAAVATPSIELQLRQADTGATADFGDRAYMYVRFLMAG